MPRTRSFVLALALAALPAACRTPAPACPPGQPAPDQAIAHDHAQGAGAAAAALPPGNVVQTEMRLMTAILEGTVRAIGARDVRGIDHQLHELHGAKEATSAAVASGAYKLPKNPDQVAVFTAMDEAFHKELADLVYASRDNDVPRAANALGKIMRGCQGCHVMFRP